MTTEQFKQRLRLHVEKHGTQRLAAQSLGISGAYLCDILNGKKEPGPSILEALGVVKITSYKVKK